jgi:hypothetical protein
MAGQGVKGVELREWLDGLKTFRSPEFPDPGKHSLWTGCSKLGAQSEHQLSSLTCWSRAQLSANRLDRTRFSSCSESRSTQLNSRQH